MIDFVATESQYFDHLFPIARELEKTNSVGIFYLSQDLYEKLNRPGFPTWKFQPIGAQSETTFIVPDGENPILSASSGDLTRWMNGENPRSRRKKILMEHGVGIVYGTDHPSYAGGKGIRSAVDLFLAPNQIIFNKTKKILPKKEQYIIGTPKLDKWHGYKDAVPQKSGPLVATISFHWKKGRMVAPEAGNAFDYYSGVLAAVKTNLMLLSDRQNIILYGHAHPRISEKLQNFYMYEGILYVKDFDHVMDYAGLYITDNSSTIYEFLVTGKPVLILNCPKFRKSVNFGIRFWDYTDIGPQCERPEDLESKIIEALEEKDKYKEAREKAVVDLFPFLGFSSKRAADFLVERFR
jgi:hypothetical protein